MILSTRKKIPGSSETVKEVHAMLNSIEDARKKEKEEIKQREPPRL